MSRSTEIALSAPVKIDGREMRRISLREPRGADLIGVQLMLLQLGDVSAYARVLPRITTPPLSAHQVEMLPLADLMAVAEAFQRFLPDGGRTLTVEASPAAGAGADANPPE